ncbi:MAG: hypothetical protein AVDCRST_MAG68-3617 [uncultured Gemmatimonadetes bacterium]|uniref:Uncharacterized protein n=1 Tax=uncultured Gemmatimonadota bacterium TaxID=203437 RepID=A0A6J4M6Y5_9BACT|nr:MAG: hypothetical protein AVDCRST_MAG68-3617 [uncultured Gemmatimonadota bacterium]
MSLKACERCGVIGRPDDDACWSCGRPPRSTAPLPAPDEAKPAGALWPVVLAAMVVGTQFLYALFNAEVVRLRLGFLGALAATAAAGLVFGWRRSWVLSAAFAAGGASAAFYGRFDPAGYAFYWLLLAALPFHVVLRRFGNRLGRLPTLPPRRRRAPSLQDEEDRTFAKLREIEEHRAQLGRSRALLARERDARPLAEVREKLGHADEVLRRQRTRHTAHLWAIEAVRWQHRLAPVVAGLDRPGDPEGRLERLAAAAGEGRRLLHDLERDAETAASEEGKRCLAQLRTLLGRCDEIREAIVVSHALQSIRRIDPAGDRAAALSPQPLESLRADLHPGTSLTAALAAFELEHERLVDDDREARDVQRFVRQLEREG